MFAADIASAATYFIRKDGNDSNAGTADNAGGAWLTLGKAASTVTAGDTVNIGDGVFSEVVTESTSGTAASPIIFQSTGYTPGTIDYGVVVGGFNLAGSNVWVRGFEVNMSGVAALSAALNFQDGGNFSRVVDMSVTGAVHNVYGLLMTTNNVSNIVASVRLVNIQQNGMTLLGRGHTVTNNYLTGTNGYDAVRLISSNTKFKNNVVTNWSNLPWTAGTLTVGRSYQWIDVSGSPDFENIGAGAPPYTVNNTWTATGTTPTSWGTATVINSAHSDVIQTFSIGALESTNVTVEGNLFINCVSCQIGNIEDQRLDGGIKDWLWTNNTMSRVDYVMSIYAPGFRFYNNTLYRSGTNSGHPFIFTVSASKGDANNGAMVNNLFIECGSQPNSTSRGWYSFDGTLTNMVDDYNAVIGTGAGTTKDASFNTANPNGFNGTDPLVVDAAGGNFRLQAGSPLIGEGENGVDIGAWQFTDSFVPAIVTNNAAGLRIRGFRTLGL